MSELQPRNEHERVENGWIVCVYCGVKMRNAAGTTSYVHPRSCEERMGTSKELLDEFYGPADNGSGSEPK